MDQPDPATTTDDIRSLGVEMEAFIARQRKPGLALHRIYPPTAFPDVRSRLGGLPQLPPDLEWPMGTSEGDVVPMHFMAQIDCAEIPLIDPDMPTTGMLFYFVVNDETQIWDVKNPRDRACVLYAPEVARDQAVRHPPDGLRPIHDVAAPDSPYYQPHWLLPGEDGPNVHIQWPILARYMDTWPDTSMATGRPPDGDWEWYCYRVKRLRLGAAVAAIGMIPLPGRVPPWGDFNSRGREELAASIRRDASFPQVGILIDRIARVLNNKRNSKARTWETLPDVAEWVQRAADIGWDEAPDEDTRRRFRDWVADQLDEGCATPLNTWNMERTMSEGVLAAIAYTGSSPKAAALFSEDLYKGFEYEHLPFDYDYVWNDQGRKKIDAPRIHQMLGDVPFINACGPEVDGDAVCLLRLVCDFAIGFDFGDLGHATFWITREDLRNRRFQGVAALMDG